MQLVAEEYFKPAPLQALQVTIDVVLMTIIVFFYNSVNLFISAVSNIKRIVRPYHLE